MIKVKAVLLKIGVTLLFFILVFLCVKEIIRKLEPTRIFEIADTRIHYDTEELEYLVAERKFSTRSLCSFTDTRT